MRFLNVVIVGLIIFHVSAASSFAQGYKLWNVKNEQAVGDGVTNDTRAIQAVINKASKGDTVYIPEGVFLVKTLSLKSGVHIKSSGKLKQHHEDAEEYTKTKQNSSRPLLRGANISNVYISINAVSRNEAIYLNECDHITINHSDFIGDSTKLQSFSGILIYKSKHIKIAHSRIVRYGTSRANTHSYQPGTGVRILSSNNISIEHSYFERNGENGVFMHGSPDVSISDSFFYHNGMSGIQVAFGSAGIEKNYSFVDNTMEYNAADGIDINNRSPRGFLNINCLIKGNVSRHNGFVKGISTPDGSGIATLINVSGVKMIDNLAEKNNRPAIYMESCGSIYAEGNKGDNQVEIVLDMKDISFIANEFRSIMMLSNVKAGKITLKKNKLTNILLPNDISIDTLLISHNEFRNAVMNFNMKGNVRLRENRIDSHSGKVAIWVVRVNSLHLESNEINSYKSGAVFVRNMAENVSVVNNTIRSVDACIADDGSSNLLIAKNTLISLKGGKTRYTFLSTNPNNLKLIKNEHNGAKLYTAVLLKGNGTAQLEHEKIVQGKTNFGDVRITRIGF